MIELTIDRTKWHRGRTPENTDVESALVTTEDTMCCLGFYGEQCLGLTDNEMRTVGDFEEIEDVLNVLFDEEGNPASEEAEKVVSNHYGVGVRNTDFVRNAIMVNDAGLSNSDLRLYRNHVVRVDSEEAREEILTKLFREEGIDVTFIK